MNLDLAVSIRDALLVAMPGGREASFVYLGLLCLLISTALFRQSLKTLRVLILGFVLYLLFAVLEIVQAGQLGRPVDWGQLGRDFLHVMVAPAVFVAFARLNWLRP